MMFEIREFHTQMFIPNMHEKNKKVSNIKATPYNHFKRDNEWSVKVYEEPENAIHFEVNALMPCEACEKAINMYLDLKRDILGEGEEKDG